MAELEKYETAQMLPHVTTSPHRQLLANIDKYVDSTSDGDGTTEDENDPNLRQDDGDAGSIIGVSMGQAQTHMKSPQTPAFEKAQVLRESRGYFGAEPGTSLDNGITLTQSPEQDTGISNSTATGSLPSPWVSQPQAHLDRRCSLTRNVLANGQTTGRKRSGSGPIALLEGLRKIFNDFQPYPGSGPNVKSDINRDPKYSENTSPKDTRTRSSRSQTVTQHSPRPMPVAGHGSTDMPGGQRIQRPESLRRTTSDNSLYLQRAVTGASEFDDTSIYASVADMPNSRFKAITDSLADSSLKLPKMPTMSFGSSRYSPSRSNSDLTRRNTALNSASSYHANMAKSRHHSVAAPHHTAASDKKPTALSSALSQLTGDLVFMGGYRGSVLRSAEPPNHQVWVPVKIGLNLRKVDLEVGLTHEDEEKMEEKIIPSGILSHIGPIDIARRLLKKATTCPNARANQLRVHDYGYDWRLSPHFLSQKLIKFLEGLECNHPDTAPERRGALVVAHSLGGLITRYAVNQRPELFSGVVYAGTPQNCVNILGPLRNGDDVFLSSRVLTAQVNFTLRTSYALLPESGRCFINRETGEQYDVDFFDINTWDEHRLSPCIAPPLPPFGAQPKKSLVGSITESISSLTPTLPTKRPSWFPGSNSPDTPSEATTTSSSKDRVQEAKEGLQSAARAASETIQSTKREAQDSIEPSMKGAGGQQHHKPSVATAVTLPKGKAREYLIRTLAEVKQFKAELKHIPALQDENRYPPHALIYGKTVPTVYGAKVASREAIKCSDAYDDLAFAAGDGVVLASAAQLPQGYRCVKGGRVESDRGHVGLLGDLEAIGKCIAAVTEGRRRGVGLGKPV